MLEKIKDFVPEFNQEAFDKTQSGLILNGILSGVGLGALALIKAAGLVKPAIVEIDLKELSEAVQDTMDQM